MSDDNEETSDDGPMSGSQGTVPDIHERAAAAAIAAARIAAAEASVPLQAALDLVKQEVDTLQIETAKKSKPWYRELSTWISAGALLLSLISTGMSVVRQESQDIIAGRAELAGLIQHLSQISQRWFETHQKYAGNDALLADMDGQLSAENVAIAKQAAQVINRLGSNVTATEIFTVSNALCAGGQFDQCLNLAELTVDRAIDFNDRAAGLRIAGAASFVLQDQEKGRAFFKRSLDLRSEFKHVPPMVAYGNDFLTQLAWAGSELQQGLFDNANAHITEAEAIVSKLPSAMVTAQKAQLAAIRAAVDQQRVPVPEGNLPAGSMPGR